MGSATAWGNDSDDAPAFSLSCDGNKEEEEVEEEEVGVALAHPPSMSAVVPLRGRLPLKELRVGS